MYDYVYISKKRLYKHSEPGKFHMSTSGFLNSCTNSSGSRTFKVGDVMVAPGSSQKQTIKRIWYEGDGNTRTYYIRFDDGGVYEPDELNNWV